MHKHKHVSRRRVYPTSQPNSKLIIISLEECVTVSQLMCVQKFEGWLLEPSINLLACNKDTWLWQSTLEMSSQLDQKTRACWRTCAVDALTRRAFIGRSQTVAVHAGDSSIRAGTVTYLGAGTASLGGGTGAPFSPLLPLCRKRKLGFLHLTHLATE